MTSSINLTRHLTDTARNGKRITSRADGLNLRKQPTGPTKSQHREQPGDVHSSVEREVAAIIRAEFIKHKRQWWQLTTGTPSNYGAGKLPRYDGGNGKVSTWLRVARKCLLSGVPPHALVSTLFETWRLPKSPEPNMLLSDRVIARVRESYSTLIDYRRHEFRANMQLLRRVVGERQRQYGVDEKTALVSVLRSGTENFSALFRYCFAFNYGYFDICDEFRSDARIQYLMSCEIYNEALGDALPQPLREYAERYRTRMGGTDATR